MSDNALSISPRPFRPGQDLASLVELHNTVEVAEGRPATLTVERLAAALDAPNLYRWVVPAPDGESELAGYGVLFHQTAERCYGDIKIHPAWRRRGIGHLLADELAGRAAELGTRYLAIDVAYDNRNAIRFLLTQGFRFRGDTWTLVAPTSWSLPEPVWPDGYTVRSYAEVDDLPLYVSLCNRTLGDLWGHWENTPGMVDESRMSDTLKHFDANGIFIVFDGGGASVAHCRTLASTGDSAPHLLDQPGVVPEARAAGLHAPLALTAARWLRDRSDRPVRLESWGDPETTIDIYESLGFDRVEHEVSYVRELGG